MALIATKTTKNSIPPLAPDTYTARCIGVVDLGEQHSETFNNYAHKVLLIFEVCGETVDVDGEAKPRWLSKDFTLSLSEKAALYKTITTWFNRPPSDIELRDGFDLSLLLNRPAMLSVAVTEKGDAQYNNITAITAVPKSITVPEATSDQLWFDISEWDQATFDKLPVWMQERIKASTEYRTKLPQGTTEIDIPADNTGAGDPNGDIPF